MTTRTRHEALDFGIPYAYHKDDGSVDCPVCGEHFPVLPRKFWKDFETEATGYAEHYQRESEAGR